MPAWLNLAKMQRLRWHPAVRQLSSASPSSLPAALQITSLFMHISPALVCWAWRWYPDPTKVRFDKMSPEQLKAYNTASWWDIGFMSMGTYMIWVVLYYLKVSTCWDTLFCCCRTISCSAFNNGTPILL